MFKIGEFARIAHINARLLRHYDDIGLLKPTYTDPATGYRYYSTRQLSTVNRIVALKELGFSLSQVSRLVHDNISPAEIRGMLLMQKAQIEQDLLNDMRRLQHVEARLEQLEYEGELFDLYDVVIKPVPASPFLSVRTIVPNFDGAIGLFRQVHHELPNVVGREGLGYMVALTYTLNYDPNDDIDIEIGYLLNDVANRYPTKFSDMPLIQRTLPAEKTMATIIQDGGEEVTVSAALGTWLEINGYQFAGVWREVYMEVGTSGNRLIEHQVPVQKIRRN